MTAALAKALRLPVRYQSAYLDETWSRYGNLLFASGHVNVTLGRRMLDARTHRDLNPITIDFLPPEEISGLRSRDIDEATVVAMYANNRAAEALADGRLDEAYAWAVASVRRDPTFDGAYNTLGVVYLRHGNLEQAARTFERVLAGAPKNTRALANLAETYGRQGRAAEADATRKRLVALEPFPPFHFFNRLGVADWRLGEEPAALRHLSLAMDNSLTRDQHNLYAAKLAWLQAHRQH